MNNKAFTLIELIASITLILILFTVAVPVSTKLIQNSNKKQCKNLVEDILTNAELYVLDHPNDYKNMTDKELEFQTLYNSGYIESEYDFKNGYKLENGLLKKDEEEKKININVIYNSDQGSTGMGYYTYELDYDICGG